MMGSQQPIVGQPLPANLGQNGQQQLLENLMIGEQRPSLEVPPVEEADPRKLCILGLPWDTTEEMLQAYFSQFGPLEEATIIRKAKTGESRGFGFVTYQNAADAEVVRAQEHTVGGRHCDAKQALPRGTTNPSRTTRLFIGRVPPRVTDAELREYFEQFGKVQDAYIPKDPATGKQGHRGFGFVTFANADDVDKVMACAHSLHSQELAVQCAIPKDKTADASLGPGRARLWQAGAVESYPMSAEASLATLANPGQPFYAFNQQALQHDGGRFSGDYSRISGEYPRPFVAAEEIHPDAAPSTSGRLHSGMLGRQAGPNMALPPPSNVSAGSRRSSLDITAQRLGSIDGGSMEQTVQALQGLTFNGGGDGIGIGLALLQARSQAANQAQALTQQQQQQLAAMQPPTSMAGVRAANGAGLRQIQPRQSYGGIPTSRGGPADANAGPRIFLGKLNKETTEQDVKDYFTRFGYVLDVYMPRDKVKRSEHRGFGFVTFETEAAVQRVAQHAPHQIKGSVIAIDSAVPRREEAPSSEDADDRTPTAATAAAAAAQAFNLQNSFARSNIISPTASAAAFANGTMGSPGASSYVNGLASPGSASHPGSSPTLQGHMPTLPGELGGSRKVSYEQQQQQQQQQRNSFDQIRSSLDSYGAGRQAPIERMRNFKQF